MTDAPMDPIETLRRLAKLVGSEKHTTQAKIDAYHASLAAIAALEAERTRTKKVAAEMLAASDPWRADANAYPVDADTIAGWANELDPSGSEPKAEGK